ncbi:hypothetical protein PGQ11_000354 [Apiospora arundinis]
MDFFHIPGVYRSYHLASLEVGDFAELWNNGRRATRHFQTPIESVFRNGILPVVVTNLSFVGCTARGGVERVLLEFKGLSDDCERAHFGEKNQATKGAGGSKWQRKGSRHGLSANQLNIIAPAPDVAPDRPAVLPARSDRVDMPPLHFRRPRSHRLFCDFKASSPLTTEDLKAVIGHFAAIAALEAPVFAHDLIHACPDGKVILNVRRNRDAWYRGVQSTILYLTTDWRMWIRSFFCVEMFWLGAPVLSLRQGYPGKAVPKWKVVVGVQDRAVGLLPPYGMGTLLRRMRLRPAKA